MRNNTQQTNTVERPSYEDQTCENPNCIVWQEDAVMWNVHIDWCKRPNIILWGKGQIQQGVVRRSAI